MEMLGEKYPELKKTLTRTLYIDDSAICDFSVEHGRYIKEQLKEKLAFHGLQFKGFCESEVGGDKDVIDSDQLMSYLGSIYHPKEDYFQLKIPKLFKGQKRKGMIENLIYFEGKTLQEMKDFFDNKITLRTILSR